MNNRNTTIDQPGNCCGIDGMPDPRFFKALSDPTRLRIMAFLAETGEPKTVSEIAEHFPIDVSVVSRHLASLKNEGILISEKQGKEVLYRMDYHFVSKIFRDMAGAIEICCPPEDK